MKEKGLLGLAHSDCSQGVDRPVLIKRMFDFGVIPRSDLPLEQRDAQVEIVLEQLMNGGIRHNDYLLVRLEERGNRYYFEVVTYR